MCFYVCNIEDCFAALPVFQPPLLPPIIKKTHIFANARWKALRASPGPRLQTALETLDANIVSVAAAEVVQRCCDTVTSQGVVALVDRPVLPLPTTLRTVLICDGIQDPGMGWLRFGHVVCLANVSVEGGMGG